jgi:hypothetical protein
LPIICSLVSREVFYIEKFISDGYFYDIRELKVLFIIFSGYLLFEIGERQHEVVLMHDHGNTVKSLPGIIKLFKDRAIPSKPIIQI